MARGVTIRFQGAENLQAKFLAMADDAKRNMLKESVPPAADIGLERMKDLVPVDEGVLRDSLAMTVQEQTATRMVMTLKTPAPHWHLVEFGHRLVSHAGKVIGQIPPNPFIRKGFRSSKTNMKNEMRDSMRDRILGFTK